MDPRVIVAIILIVIVVAVVGNAGSSPSGQSRQSPRSARRAADYHRLQEYSRRGAEIRARARREAMEEGIRRVWKPRIDSENRRASAAASRAQRRIDAGKSPGRHASAASRHDNRAAEYQRTWNKEHNLMTNLWDRAIGGDRRAQRLTGTVHPRTGHTTGGIGREGHRPSDHMPVIRKKKNGGK